MVDYTKPVYTKVTFTATDNTLTSHIWKIDDIQKSTSNPFIYTFDTTGTFTVKHEGSNNQGDCTPVTKTIEITSTPTTPIEENPILLYIIGGSIGVATLIYILSKKGATK